MRVMLSSGVDLVGVASWSKGEMRLEFGCEMDAMDKGLLVEGVEEGGRPRAGALVFVLLPWRVPYVCADGRQVAVHTFRYESVAGGAAYLGWCATCGADRRMSLVDLEGCGCWPCARCGALPSNVSCVRWHCWGTCPECPPSVERQSSMMEAAAAKGGVMSVAEDRDHPKAGPSAPSLGSAGLMAGVGGVSPADPVDAGSIGV